MTFKMTLAALAAALSFSAPAWAGDQTNAPQGHWEWRSAPQFGPKAPLTAPRRVWVPDTAQMANCDCDMMKMSAADCMMNTHKPKAPSAG